MTYLYLAAPISNNSIVPFREMNDAVDYLVNICKMTKKEAISNIARIEMGNFRCYTYYDGKTYD